MFDTRYPFFSAYLKGEEARLITSDHIGRMAKVPGFRDVVEVIRDTAIGGYLDGVLVESFDDADEQLWMYLGECVRRVEWFRPVPADMIRILRAYIVKYDVLNIKMAVQGITDGRPTRKIPVGFIHDHGLLDELSAVDSMESIIALLARCQLGNYAVVLERDGVGEVGEPDLLVGARLDAEYYQNLMGMTRGINNGALLAKAFGIVIDVKNLQVVLRAIIMGTGLEAAEYIISGGYMLSPEAVGELLSLKLEEVPGRVEYLYRDMATEVVSSYDRTGSVVAVGEVVEKYGFMLTREILSPRLLSPLMVAWYLLIKEIEIRNLRLILKAVYDNIPVDEVKDYLVLAS